MTEKKIKSILKSGCKIRANETSAVEVVRKFACLQCQTTFSKMIHLSVHVLSLHYCHQENKFYDSAQKLKERLLYHYRGNWCPHCPDKPKHETGRELVQHIGQFHRNIRCKYSCPFCHRDLNVHPEDFSRHISNHLKKVVYRQWINSNANLTRAEFWVGVSAAFNRWKDSIVLSGKNFFLEIKII